MVNLLLFFVLASAAYIFLPACQNAFMRWSYGWGATNKVENKGAPELPTKLLEAATMPVELLAYVSSWGDQWAREDAMERAKRLYLKHANWELVYQELLAQDGEAVKVNG